jgi:hypothetical protein
VCSSDLDNASALGVRLTPEQRAELDAVSAPDARLIYGLLQPAMRRNVVFGADVTDFGGR